MVASFLAPKRVATPRTDELRVSTLDDMHSSDQSEMRYVHFPPSLTTTLAHDALQLSKSVVHFVVHTLSLQLWMQVLWASSHFTWQSVAVTSSPHPPNEPMAAAANSALVAKIRGFVMPDGQARPMPTSFDPGAARAHRRLTVTIRHGTEARSPQARRYFGSEERRGSVDSFSRGPLDWDVDVH